MYRHVTIINKITYLLIVINMVYDMLFASLSGYNLVTV